MTLSLEANDEVFAAVQGAAEAYCEAVHAADTGTLARVFHPDAHLYISEGGRLVDWPLAAFLERVGAREGFAGPADYAIETVDVAGPDLAMVRLAIAVPPRRFVDYLNFLKVEGEWRIVAKVFRRAEGPAL